MDLWGWTLTGSTAGVLGKLTNISYSGLNIDEIDVTNADSTGKWNEYEGGFKDPGVLSGDLIFDPAVLETLLAAFGVSQTWTLEKDTKVLTVDGYIRNPQVNIPLRSAAMLSIEIRCSSQPSFNSSSSSSSSSSA